MYVRPLFREGLLELLTPYPLALQSKVRLGEGEFAGENKKEGGQAYSSLETCRSQLPACLMILCSKRKQGRIEPPKAVRGHATSYSAHIDGIVLSVTKNNVSG